ncbi:hypothetical protein L209DRAFT_460021 [Thermothelomyces heterothallicus CBS 203.75]
MYGNEKRVALGILGIGFVVITGMARQRGRPEGWYRATMVFFFCLWFGRGDEDQT